MIVFVFPGQGSQCKGMGQELFDKTPQFLAIEKQIDSLLGYSLRSLCIENPANRLNDTQYTQPALFVVNALFHYQAVAIHGTPAVVSGHSLGEYNALHAAGVFNLLTGIRLVRQRGRLMAQARNGGMAAVVGLTPEKVDQILQDHGLTSIDLSNYNSPRQIVISGPVDDLERAMAVLECAGAAMCIRLPVSAAFHSRYMQSAANEYEAFLREFKFETPKIPIISNVTAAYYPATSIQHLLVKQITQPVMWMQIVRALIAQGAKEFVEVGPGSVLTRLIQQIRAG